ncbi:PREDICTED: POM121-like protein 2 [Condylura cristata]|uniref:POM121-like protein 2 n=1 Tax=Condylura cristata TaxID=143302 RepID=UPI0003344970|nr:PREDICTED: POM121-like protein 2 [Condylura cristata]
MGSYLGKSGPQPRPPAQVRTDLPESPVNRRPAQPLHQIHRVQHVHRAHPAPRHRPARRPPNWDPNNPTSWGVNEAWRRFPMRRPLNSIMGPLPSDWWESYLKRSIWSLRHPQATWSPVTVKIAPPERRAPPTTSPAEVINSAESSLPEKARDPCAKETVLQAISQSTKGRARLQEPLFPQSLDRKRRSSEARSSAFKPLMKNGTRTYFVPKAGLLKKSLHSWNSDHSLKKRPSCCSKNSLASTHPGSSLRSKRNVITSSYSSSRNFSQKRSVPSASLQTPEWPVKKKDKGHLVHSPSPLVSESGRSGQQNQMIPLLPCSPQNLLALAPPPQLGYVLPEEDLDRGELRLTWNKCGEEGVTEPATVSGPETQSATEPSPEHTPPSAGSAPAQGPHPQLGKQMQEPPGPAAYPQSTGEALRVGGSPLNTPRLLTPPGCSPSAPPPDTSPDCKPEAAFILLTPVSPTTSVPATTWPPSTLQAGEASLPQLLPAATPLTPATQSHLFGMMSSPAPHLPEPTPLTAASADHLSKCTLGLTPASEIRGCFYSRISVTTVASSMSGTSTPTFKPIFGSMAPLQTMPVTPPHSSKQLSPPATPVSTDLFQGLVKATSVVLSTAQANTCKDTVSTPPLDSGVVNAPRTPSDTSSVPSTCHTFLLGAARAFRASFSPATGFVFPPHTCPSTPSVHTVTIFGQVLPSGGQMSPHSSAASFRDLKSPQQVSALATPDQSALCSSTSQPNSASPVPLGSSATPTFLLSPAATPPPAFGGAARQKQEFPQPALGLSFNSSLILGSSAITSTPAPTPPQPAFSSPTQAARAGPTPSPSTSPFHSPVRARQGSGGGRPAAFPFGPASATGFRAASQTACRSVFGSTAPRPFAFGGLVTPMDCGDSGVSLAAPHTRSTSGPRSSVATASRGTSSTASPFGKAWSQNARGPSSQSTPFVLGRASISARKNMFGGACRASCDQSTAAHGPVKTGSKHSFGVSSPPSQGFVGRPSFRSSAPSFSMGAKSKPPKNREQWHSRRHHAHKK